MPLRTEAVAGTSARPVSALSNDQLAGLLDAWARSGVRIARTDSEMRIYISGPMTGKPDLNRPAFAAAEKRLTAQGHFVINPHRISAPFGTAEELECSFFALYELEKPQNAYTTMSDIDKATNEDSARLARAVMDADLAAVRSCDAIYLLRGWETSRGAKKELAEALAHGLQVMQEGGGE